MIDVGGCEGSIPSKWRHSAEDFSWFSPLAIKTEVTSYVGYEHVPPTTFIHDISLSLDVFNAIFFILYFVNLVRSQIFQTIIIFSRVYDLKTCFSAQIMPSFIGWIPPIARWLKISHERY